MAQKPPIRAGRMIATLRTILPDDAVVISDPGTSCSYFLNYYQSALAGRSVITNRAHGALGSASLGPWYGQPGSKAVSMMGGGSFGFTCGDLKTPENQERLLREASDHGGPALIDVISRPLKKARSPVRRWMG